MSSCGKFYECIDGGCQKYVPWAQKALLAEKRDLVGLGKQAPVDEPVLKLKSLVTKVEGVESRMLSIWIPPKACLNQP